MKAEERKKVGGPHTADDMRTFEHRSALLKLAHRMLGSRAEAEDAVQDTFVRWHEADRSAIHNGAAWLTTTCRRRCIDLMRRAERRRDRGEAGITEAVHTTAVADEECTMRLASSVATAFALMLERLSAKERAAYLLYDIFDMSYARIATTLSLDAAACRKLVSRARLSIGQARARVKPPPSTRQQELLSAFHEAIETGDAVGFSAMLVDDIEAAFRRRPTRGAPWAQRRSNTIPSLRSNDW